MLYDLLLSFIHISTRNRTLSIISDCRLGERNNQRRPGVTPFYEGSVSAMNVAFFLDF